MPSVRGGAIVADVIPSAPLETEAAGDLWGPADAGEVRPGVATGRRFRFELAARPSSVAQARELTRARLAGWSACEDTCDTAALVVSELVTNAIVHTAGERVVCELRDEHDVVRIAVRDEGCAPGQPHPAPSLPEEEHGRGLLLVATLCRAWGAQQAGAGLLVWAELPREGDRPTEAGPVVPAQPSRDLPCSGGRSRAVEGTAPEDTASTGTGHGPDRSAGEPASDGEARSDLGWSAKRPPADGQGSGAGAYGGTRTAWA
ncbi:ATP-binding protein [Streptomyces nodosus]|uniref:ATP-binding protein n=1 Tax=Streptomyces nodosus TaxID=40318 RepID=A0A5P2W040_9ACTN|nr:ATP-binding protein [Streptomyces nodosus]QEV38775.1 ATP-binding protein [Streptomyces nodosus]